MAVLYKTAKLSRNLFSKNVNISKDKLIRLFRTVVQESKSSNGIFKTSLIGAVIGTAIGAGYAYQKISLDRKNIALDGTEIKIDVLKYKPKITPSRKIVSSVDPTDLKLTLFQYQTCPFCCKVRTFLDYYGIAYDVVEVDPVLRNEIKWSSYTKVPILLAKVNDGYQPLNDSSMILSVLASYLNDQNSKIDELVKYYPNIAMHDDTGKFKHEIVNKYFLMYQGSLPKNRCIDDIVEERKWRKWADEVLVHTLSPNVYRTLGEAYQTFHWFSDIGRWEEYFPFWERKLMVNVGALSMWIIGKRLKKRYNLKDDVRQSFYNELNVWLDAINARGGPFMGGSNPDLSDLAVYGILRSIEGCDAFKDAFEHTKIETWFRAMKERVDNHSGATLLNG